MPFLLAFIIIFLQASKGSLSFGLNICYKPAHPTSFLGFLSDIMLILSYESSSKLQSSKSVSDFSPLYFLTSYL